jgi:hypothetical protein
VGGKSGTAYKQIGKGYGSDGNRKYRSWFVGMAPIDKPRIIVGRHARRAQRRASISAARSPPRFSAKWCSTACASWACSPTMFGAPANRRHRRGREFLMLRVQTPAAEALAWLQARVTGTLVSDSRAVRAG